MRERKKTTYTMSPAALAQRRAASAANAAKNPAREFATVRIDRVIRDAAETVCKPGESLAAFVGAATLREVKRRGGTAPID